MSAAITIRYPLLLLLVSYAVGILVGGQIEVSLHQCFWLLATLVFGIFFIHYRFNSYGRRWVFGILLSLIFFLLGALNFNVQKPLKTLWPESLRAFKLTSYPEEKAKTYAVNGLILSKEPKLNGLKYRLYLPKCTGLDTLIPGDIIAVKTTLEEARILNPEEFDYERYLSLKGYSGRLSVGQGNWWLVAKSDGGGVFFWALNLRQSLIDIIDQWGMSAHATSLAKALLVGARGEMDNDLKQAYAAAGAMHVLAVSGLHVGIFYLILFYSLAPLAGWKRGKIMRGLFMVVILWAYALISGFSASVVRAVCMFSLIALAKAGQRPSSAHHAVLSSAFILLLVNPAYLFTVGFQLSYAAVLGIITIQPKLQSFFRPKYWLPRQVWNLMSVSIAAQWATLAFSLYYFKLFPSLFLLTNLIAIPLITSLMYIGLGALLWSAISPNTVHWAAKFFEQISHLMNQSMLWIESCHLDLNNIHLNSQSFYLLGFTILAFTAWFLKGGFRRLILSVGLLGLLIFNEGIFLLQRHRPEFVIYNAPHKLIMAISEGGKMTILTEDHLVRAPHKISYQTSGHILSRSFGKPEVMSLNNNHTRPYFKKSGNIISWKKGHFLLVNEAEISAHYQPFKHWIVTENVLPPTGKVYPKEAILSPKLSSTSLKRWQEWATKKKVLLWQVASDGPYIARDPLLNL